MASIWDQDPPEDTVQTKSIWDADPPDDTAVATAPSTPPSGYLTEAPPIHPLARVGNFITEFLRGTFRDPGVPITNPQAEMPGYVAGKETMDAVREASPYILAGAMTGGAALPLLQSGTVGGIGAGMAIEGLTQGAANIVKQTVNQTDDPISMLQDLGMGAAFSGVPAMVGSKVGVPAVNAAVDELKNLPGLKGIMGENVTPPVSTIAADTKAPVNMIDDAPPVTPAPVVDKGGDVTLGTFGAIDDATVKDIAQKAKNLATETPAPDAGTAIETFGRPVQNFERGWGERIYNNMSKSFGKIVPDFLKNPNKRITLEQSKALLQSIPDAQSEADLLKNALEREWSAINKQSGGLTADMVTSGNAPAVKAFTDKMFKLATDAGIPLNKLQNYLTRQTKAVIGERMTDDFIKLRRILGKASETGTLTDTAVETALKNTSKDTQEAIKYLVDTKQAKSVSEAYDMLGARFEEDLTQTYGVNRVYKTPFEKARGATLPDRFYETNVNTLMRNYVSKMSKRIVSAQKFGVNGEKVTAALNKIGQYDQSEQKFISDVFDLYTGKYQLEHGLSGGAQKIQRAVTNTIIAGKIGTGLSTIANSLQTTISSIPQVGYWRAVNGGVSLMSKSGRAYAKAIAGDYRGFEEALGGFQDKAFTSKLTHLLTEGTGFNATNYMNLILGSSMYKPYVQDLYKIAQGRGARALWAKSNLADLGIDVSQKLDDDILARAVHTLTFDSQLMEKVSTSPFYLNNPRLRWLTSLKRFSVNQFIRNKDLVGKELSRGNTLPLLRLAAAGVAGGEAIVWAKNQIRSALPGQQPQYRKEDSMWERVGNDVAASGTLGIFTDVFTADNPTELINKIAQAATPAPISIGLAAKDEAKVVAKRAKTVGLGPALRKEAGDIAGVLGGAYASGAADAIFQTPGDIAENSKANREQEKAAINDLYVQGKYEAARKRILLWNENNPKYGFKSKEFTNKSIKKIIKNRAEKKYEATQ
jgi:hypothetical protein